MTCLPFSIKSCFRRSAPSPLPEASKTEHPEAQRSRTERSQNEYSQNNLSRIEFSRIDHPQRNLPTVDYTCMGYPHLDFSALESSQLDLSQIEHSYIEPSRTDLSGTQHAYSESSYLDDLSTRRNSGPLYEKEIHAFFKKEQNIFWERFFKIFRVEFKHSKNIVIIIEIEPKSFFYNAYINLNKSISYNERYNTILNTVNLLKNEIEPLFDENDRSEIAKKNFLTKSLLYENIISLDKVKKLFSVAPGFRINIFQYDFHKKEINKNNKENTLKKLPKNMYDFIEKDYILKRYKKKCLYKNRFFITKNSFEENYKEIIRRNVIKENIVKLIDSECCDNAPYDICSIIAGYV